MSSGPAAGKIKGQAKQNLFLIYLDALSIVNNKRADKGLPQQQPEQQPHSEQQQQQFDQQLQLQRQLSAAAPNMPDFTLKDLQFILTFTGELGSTVAPHTPGILRPVRMSMRKAWI